MQIIAKCPNCCRSWQLESSAADRRVRCRSCRTLFKVPKCEELPKASEVIEKSVIGSEVTQWGET